MIFGGTTEGRIIFERLFPQNKNTFLFVATELGKDYIKKDSQGENIFVGRLNKEDIIKKLSHLAPDYLIDATHIYATEISENLHQAVLESKAKPKLIKIKRQISPFDGTAFNNFESAVSYLKTKTGNILLTIGTTHLEPFFNEKSLRERLFVRALHNDFSKNNCKALGIPLSHCFFGNGKATEMENIENLKISKAKFLVTKNSGEQGGFSEKLSACKKLSVEPIVVMPSNLKNTEDEVSIDELFQILEEEK